MTDINKRNNTTVLRKDIFKILKTPRVLYSSMTEPSSKRRENRTEDDFVNYMPGMPKLSSEPGRVERFVTRLFRRRGPLRAVFRDRNE